MLRDLKWVKRSQSEYSFQNNKKKPKGLHARKSNKLNKPNYAKQESRTKFKWKIKEKCF